MCIIGDQADYDLKQGLWTEKSEISDLSTFAPLYKIKSFLKKVENGGIKSKSDNGKWQSQQNNFEVLLLLLLSFSFFIYTWYTKVNEWPVHIAFKNWVFY